MASTYYVSNVASNGYAVGSDANAGTSKGAPKLTVTGAFNASGSGDTIICNAGTYSEAGYVNLQHAVTLKADTGLTAILRTANAPDARVIHVAATASGSVIGSADATLALDGQGVQTNCLTTDSGSQVAALTIIGVSVKGFLSNGLNFGRIGNLQLVDANWVVDLTGANTGSAGILLNPGTNADAYTIKNGTVQGTGLSLALYSGILGNAPATSAGSTVTINGVRVNLAVTVNNNTVECIHVQGGNNATISGNIINGTGSFGTLSAGDGIWVSLPPAGQTSASVVVTNNTITFPNGTGNIGIQIGLNNQAPAPTGANGLNGVLVTGNKVTGANHGILLSWISGAVCWGNLATQTVLGIVDKHTNASGGGASLITGNIVDFRSNALATYGLYSKAAAGTIWANNLVLLDSTCVTVQPLLCINDPAGTVTISTNCVYRNNLVYSASGLAQYGAIVGGASDLSTATFANNDYFAAGGFAANPFNYQGTAYANLAAWVTAHEATARAVSPGFVNYAGGDYRVPPASGLYRAGSFVDWRAVDYRGRPFWAGPTIGAYEVTSGDQAVNRAVRV